MKNMKERFHKLITVILCFLVSMVPKRDEVDVSVIGQAVTASPVNGNAAGAATVSAENSEYVDSAQSKTSSHVEKTFFLASGSG